MPPQIIAETYKLADSGRYLTAEAIEKQLLKRGYDTKHCPLFRNQEQAEAIRKRCEQAANSLQDTK